MLQKRTLFSEPSAGRFACVGHIVIGIDLACKHVFYDGARGLYSLTEADLRFLDWVRSEG